MGELTIDKLEEARKFLDENGFSASQLVEIHKIANNCFWDGFDSCLDLVLNSLDTQESNEIAKMSVWEFIEDFKQHLIEEAELYKTDG